ncbi:MAG: zinc metallopeptidase [Akkermansiaceae bacterium]|nr:zinc metallopeptidase [Akkermansiaceae bacterium]
MWKILLLISLLPTVAAVVGRKWLFERVVKEFVGHETNRTGREVAVALLKESGKAAQVAIVEKRKPGVSLEPPQLELSKELSEAKDVVSLGQVAALTGQAMVAAEQPDLIKWRQWVLRFSWAFPIFTFVVVAFALVVAKLGAAWAIVSVLGALGLASSLSLASVLIEVEGAKLAQNMLDRSRVLPRSDDEEEVGRCCRAFAFRRVVPGAVEWMFGDPGKKGED